MGNTSSMDIIEPVNYNCPTCRKSNKLPNIAGRFHIINNYECKCNGCNSVYPKERFYKKIIL